MGYADRVKDTTTTTGTGDITLSGTAPAGYQAFGTAFAINDPIDYCITDGTSWEVGVGYLSATTTLVRDRVLRSSNSDNAVNWGAGTKDVLNVLPADEIIDQGVAQAGFACLINI
jgi:hypothetical protein